MNNRAPRGIPRNSRRSSRASPSVRANAEEVKQPPRPPPAQVPPPVPAVLPVRKPARSEILPRTSEELKSGAEEEKALSAATPGKSGKLPCDICYEIVTVQGIIECCTHNFCFTCIKRWSEVRDGTKIID